MQVTYSPFESVVSRGQSGAGSRSSRILDKVSGREVAAAEGSSSASDLDWLDSVTEVSSLSCSSRDVSVTVFSSSAIATSARNCAAFLACAAAKALRGSTKQSIGLSNITRFPEQLTLCKRLFSTPFWHCSPCESGKVAFREQFNPIQSHVLF